ncbi:MAG TPA: hypothetical protein VGJ70_00905, partial [Solirubrobacteraceae bacterium]
MTVEADVHGTLGGPLAARNALAFAILAGILHGICFPPLGAWPLAFVSLAPLVAAARGRTVVAGGLLGWLAGTIASTITAVPWIATAAHDYFRHGFVGAVVFASVLLQVFGALPIALFAAAVARLSRLQPAPLRVLASAAAWTALELARARALTGAPWDLLAHALYAQPLWIQLADLGGAFAVSFVLAACAAAAAELLVGTRRDARAAVAIASALVAATVAYGAVRLRAVRDDAEPVLRVALVQANVPNSWRLVPARAGDAFRAFADTTRPLVRTR